MTGKIYIFRVLTAAELQLFEAGDPASINPEMGVDEQAELLPYNRHATTILVKKCCKDDV